MASLYFAFSAWSWRRFPSASKATAGAVGAAPSSVTMFLRFTWAHPRPPTDRITSWQPGWASVTRSGCRAWHTRRTGCKRRWGAEAVSSWQQRMARATAAIHIGDDPRPAGSGVLIEPDKILTCRHVVAQSDGRGEIQRPVLVRLPGFEPVA